MICGYEHVVLTIASVSGAAEAIPAVPSSAAATPPDAIKALVAIRILICLPTLFLTDVSRTAAHAAIRCEQCITLSMKSSSCPFVLHELTTNSDVQFPVRRRTGPPFVI